MSGSDFTMDELCELLSSSSGVRIDPAELGAATTFDDLGLDSLALLGVITAIERNRGVELPAEAQEIRSVQEFLSTLNDTLGKAA